MFCLPHPNMTRHRTHLGITLIEVMMSTMVVSLGILGLVALIPLGTHLTERGVRADRIANLGPRAFHEARARGVFNPNNWVNATSYGVAATTGGNNPRPLRQPYMIDPMFFGSNGTDTSRRFFPYVGTLAVGQTMPATEIYTTGKPMRMHRLSIARNPNVTSPIALNFPLAKAAFQSDDDLAFERPDDGELPSFQRFYQRGSPAASVKRQALGEYSWMVMLTPEPFDLSTVSRVTTGLDNNDGRYLHPPIDTTTANGSASKAELNSTLANASTDEYTAHVIITRNRLGNMPTGDVSVIDTDEEKTNERIVDVSGFFAPGGYSTGEVELQVTGGTLEEAEDLYLKVSNGDWICLARRMPVAGGSQASYSRGDLYQWYKVVMVDDVVETSGVFTRRLTLNGPDWPTSVAAYAPTHAIIVDGVVGVYTKRVRLETQSPWSP